VGHGKQKFTIVYICHWILPHFTSKLFAIMIAHTSGQTARTHARTHTHTHILWTRSASQCQARKWGDLRLKMQEQNIKSTSGFYADFFVYEGVRQFLWCKGAKDTEINNPGAGLCSV